MKKTPCYPIKKWLQTGLVVLPGFFAMLPSTARAIGFLLPNQDPKAIGRGNAFAATADNPSAIYYNPAGITQISGLEVEVGDVNYIGINATYSPPGGGDVHSKFEFTPVPEVYAVYSPTNLPLSFGLGVYAPFGLGVEWPGNSSLRQLAIESRMQFITVNPVVAYKIIPSLSIAAGPAVNYSELKIRRGLFSSADQFTFKGNDFSCGFTAGILWHPVQEWSFGLDYRSASSMYYGGQSTYEPGNGSTFSTPTTTRVPFPQTAALGVSYRPTDQWNVEANVEWINTHKIETLTLGGTANLFGPDLQFNLHWHDTWIYKLGVTRYFEDGWYVSAGYFYTSSTTSSDYFTPAVPDTELHTGSVGFGRDGEHWHWAVAGQIIAGPQRSVATTANDVNPVTQASPAGKYALFIPTLSVSVSYRF